MKSARTTLLACIVTATCLFTTTIFPAHSFAQSRTERDGAGLGDLRAIRVAPPSPVFADAERVAELKSRRARVAQKIGANGVLIMFSTEPRVYSNDVDYEYRQENNLFYLTNLKQRGATLVLMPGNTQTPEILFLPRRNPAAETWTGRMYSAEEAGRVSGVAEVWAATEFEPFLVALRRAQPYRPQAENILRSNLPPADPLAIAANGRNANRQTATPTNAAPTPDGRRVVEQPYLAAGMNKAELYLNYPPLGGDNREYRHEQQFAADWAKAPGGFSLRSAWNTFGEMRLQKSAYEMRLMQHAIDITTEALGRAMASAGRAGYEYEVEAEVEYTFKRRNADFWGYPSIVGCGPNATTLHYETSQGKINKNDLLLMDVGAEYEHYTADVTRTFPVGGKFTAAQAEIYNIVLAAQESAFKQIKIGAPLGDVHKAATETIKDGLLRVGLITDRNSNQHLIWFMHGTSHWLGMNVHDVGTRGATIQPGVVFTVEPGIYIREDALDNLEKTPANERFIQAVRPAFERYKNIGVRIEDDMTVNSDGSYKMLTAALPRTVADIESFIARAAREIPTSSFERDRQTQSNGEARTNLINARFTDDAVITTMLSSDENELWQMIGRTRSRGRSLRRGFVRVGTPRTYARLAHKH